MSKGNKILLIVVSIYIYLAICYFAFIIGADCANTKQTRISSSDPVYLDQIEITKGFFKGYTGLIVKAGNEWTDHNDFFRLGREYMVQLAGDNKLIYIKRNSFRIIKNELH